MLRITSLVPPKSELELVQMLLDLCFPKLFKLIYPKFMARIPLCQLHSLLPAVVGLLECKNQYCHLIKISLNCYQSTIIVVKHMPNNIVSWSRYRAITNKNIKH